MDRLKPPLDEPYGQWSGTSVYIATTYISRMQLLIKQKHHPTRQVLYSGGDLPSRTRKRTGLVRGSPNERGALGGVERHLGRHWGAQFRRGGRRAHTESMNGV